MKGMPLSATLRVAPANLKQRRAGRLAGRHLLADAQTAGPETTTPTGKLDTVMYGNSRQWRIKCQLSLAAPRRDHEFGRLEVEHRRIGPDVIGLGRLAVEHHTSRGRRRVQGIVQPQIAGNVPQAGTAHLPERGQQIFDHELGVTAANQHQIALQDAIDKFAVQIETGLPAVIGPQLQQAGVSGQQFDT